ncbi:MAG: hypothetical protein LQ338_008214 [Usnochroma carphineum]|nr:MAG: hypothetical protein LQ338_008214 [Usnochroma carphineum]
MSGMLDFVGKRQVPQGVELKGDFEDKDRLQRTLNKVVHVSHSISGATDGRGNAKQRDRPPSRQEIASDLRVSTPPFISQGKGPDPRSTLQQSRVPSKTTLITREAGNNQKGATRIARETLDSKDPFDTDTGHLDDTSTLSGLANPAGFATKSEGVPEVDRHLQAQSIPVRTLQASQKPHDAYPSRITASPASESYAETSADHDGDDELDDPSQHTDLHFRGVHPPGSYHPERAAIASNGKETSGEALLFQAEQQAHGMNQASYPPNAFPRFSKPAFPGHSRQHSQEIRSVDNASMYNDEPDSEYGNTGPQETDDRSMLFRGMAEDQVDYSDVHLMNSRNDKRKRSPGMGFHNAVPGLELAEAHRHAGRHSASGRDGFRKPPIPNKNHKLANGKIQEGLDYDLNALSQMSYHQLAEESFDKMPKPVELANPSLTDKSTLQEKLVHLQSLDGPREQVQSQRQAFFSSLPIDQYEECGDLMAEHFSRIVDGFKQARQRKRSVAKEFENEIARREKVVEGRKNAVAKDLDRLKRAGQDVVGGK